MQEIRDTTNSRSILNNCAYIKAELNSLEIGLQQAYKQAYKHPNSPSNYLSRFSFNLIEERVKKIKSDPESENPINVDQVRLVQRRLEETKTKIKKFESDLRKHAQTDAVRLEEISSYIAKETEARGVPEGSVRNTFQQNVCISRFDIIY
jgi:syntaxin 1B/2/3